MILSILDFTIQQKTILSGIDLNQSILSSGSILNPINNIQTVATSIRNAMKLMTDYIKNNNQNVIKNGRIVDIVLSITIALIYIVTLVIEIKWINSNKQETYQCLFSLPKKVVSELAENRDSKSKENKNEEINKQDENILKIFNSGGSDESLSDMILMVIGTVFISLVLVINVILFYFLNFEKKFNENSFLEKINDKLINISLLQNMFYDENLLLNQTKISTLIDSEKKILNEIK